ncbi:MAG: hypothetical protein IJG80_09795, partial [Selenomonadaceae bacterium]|nr:hypothetical protein [Selenomonadaceae bacterium]
MTVVTIVRLGSAPTSSISLAQIIMMWSPSITSPRSSMQRQRSASPSWAMPTVLERLGANLILLGNRPNGININDYCGSTHMENLRLEVLKNRADIGIAHDGDADRCLCIDERGEIIDGDHIMIICA